MARTTTRFQLGGAPGDRARSAALLAAAAVALACSSRPAGPPRPTSITPDRGAAGVATSVRIAGEGFGGQVSADFVTGGGDVIDTRYQVLLGTIPLDDVALRPDGTIQATVPAGLALGPHDLTVVDPAGRAGTLPGAYRVLAVTDTATTIARFRVEPVAAQVAYAPFTIAVTALDAAGAVVTDFTGEVQLSDASGTVVPASLGLFSGGRWTGAVEVRASRAGDVLTASLGGATGSSAPFDVAPTPAAAVRFVTPALDLQAGACGGPVTVSLRDAFGLATTAAAPVTAAVAAAAPGVAMYADAGCTIPADAAAVAAGQGSASFWLVATAAGPLQLTLSAPTLTGDSLTGTVAPGPPAALAFVTAPQTAIAGGCSGIATLQPRDAGGNPAPLSATAATSVALTAPGLTLHADPACAGAPVTSVALPAGGTTASLYFRGASAGAATITASATGVAPATQTETIVAAAAAQLAFTTGAQTVTTGACSGIATVQAVDAWANPSAPSSTAATAVSLSAPGLTLYADAACATLPVAAVSIPAAASSASFYFRGTAAGPATVTATASGLAAASQGETLVAAAASQLAFTTTAQTVTAGACSGIATVQAGDAWTNPSAPSATATTAVTLSAPGLTLYTDAACATAAVTAVSIPAAASSASFYFRGTAAGPATVSASAAGLTPATQGQTIVAGPTDHHVWSTVPTPQSAGVAFSATITAVDAYGNRSDSSATATLSASAGTVSCATSCTSATETSSFTHGQWTGTLVVPTGSTALTLTATTSGRTGTSNAFDVIAPPGRSPPVARFTASARVITSGNSITFDASGSSDGQTGASALSVSWHFEALDADFASAAAPDASPWTPWTTTKTATHAFLNNTGVPIIYHPRLAVQDTEAGPGGPDVGYATEVIVVLPSASNVCVVDTDSLVDDNNWANTCDVKGTDGRTSLAEAVRIANGSAAPMNIIFSGTRHIVGGGQTFWMNTPVRFLADPGAVVLDGVSLALNATGILVSGLEFTRLTTPILVADASEVRLEDLYVHDGAGIEVRGQGRVVRARMSGCSGVACVYTSSWGAYLALFSSDLQGPGTGVGVSVDTCASATPGVMGTGSSPYLSFLNGWSDTGSAFIAASVLTGFDVAVSGGTALTCPHPVVANVTFDRNGTGVRRGDAGGYVLDSVFTNHTAAAIDPAVCAFDQLARNLTWQNATDGCLASSTGLLAADPLFLDAAARDYRLQHASPAKDAGSANGTEVDDAAPGLYLGAAPDRGGRETW